MRIARTAAVVWIFLVSLAPAFSQTVDPAKPLPPAAIASAAAPAKSTLRIASYNVENLFDVFDDPYTKDESTRVKPRKELEQVAAIIRKLDADVVVLSEVENEGAVKAFADELLKDLGYRHVAAGSSNDERGIRLAILSRLPIVSMTSHRFLDLKLEGEPTTWRFARDLTRFRLQATASRTLDLYVVHLKSKHDSAGDPQSGKWRLAEATKAKQIIDEQLKENPDQWLAMAGDFNDTPDSEPIKKLLAPPAAAEKGTGLVDAHAALPAEQRITYLKGKFRSTIDYIMASPSLAKRAVKGSAQVGVEGVALEGSDHAPIVVTFDVRESP